MNESDQTLVFGTELTSGNEHSAEIVELEPVSKSQDRYVFRNFKNYVSKKAKSFAYAAVKCFRTYTNFKAFIPNVTRKYHSFCRFWKENYKPLVLLSRLGEFWTDFTLWSRKKHRFFSFYVWLGVLAFATLIIYMTFDSYTLDEGGKPIYLSFWAKKSMEMLIVSLIAFLGFIQTAFGLNNLYRKLINMTRKYPLTMSVFIAAIVAGVLPLLFTINKPDFLKAYTTPLAVCSALAVYIILDCSVGLLSRKIFAKSDDGSNALANTVKGYMYLAPALIPLIVFTFYPMINAIFMGFVRFDSTFIYNKWSLGEFFNRLFTDATFRANNVTLRWFELTLTDPEFYHSLVTTMIIVLITVPVSTAISVFLAVLMNAVKKFQGLYQTIYFLPYVTAMTAVTSVWRLILDETGVLNSLLGLDMNWLSSGDAWFVVGSFDFLGISNGSPISVPSAWAYQFYPQLLGFIIYSIWNGLAFKIVIFLTGLQSIDKQVYQAAQLDGASKRRTFFKITLPLLAPIMLFITTTSMISAFKTYTSTKSLFLNNPRFETIVFYMFFFIDGTKNGYDRASAVAVILFVLIMSFTGCRLLLKNRKRRRNDPNLNATRKVKGRQKIKRADRILAGGNKN